MTSYPASRRYHVNVGRMDLVVVQYQMVGVGSPDGKAWRIPVFYSNACSGVRSLGIVVWVCSAIVTTGAVEQSNWCKDAAALEIHPILPQRIRTITYRYSANRSFY